MATTPCIYKICAFLPLDATKSHALGLSIFIPPSELRENMSLKSPPFAK